MTTSLEGKTFVLGVGAQKAGTTWLYDHLDRTPGIELSPIKELHFFDTWYLGGPQAMKELRQRSRAEGGRIAHNYSAEKAARLLAILDRSLMLDFDRYFAHFERIGDPSSPFVGEITPAYALLSAENFGEIKRACNDRGMQVKVVFLMREPVDRMRSAARMTVATKGAESFEDTYRRLLSMRPHVDRGRYEKQVPALREVFGDDLYVTFYETFFGGGTAEFDRLVDFLGVERVAPDLAHRVHTYAMEARDLPAELVRQAAETYAPTFAFVDAEFGDQVPAAWAARGGAGRGRRRAATVGG
ncbi:sulfotransferase family protein [Sediminihabitans luteus]|uniref:Sulfotransferase family protein n=1 Tax=Sediminihabitans luteus TaxID=1138585 RepID=A0A2M9CE37_9CELL|nr:sulfotransferase [Sediminihabitans luteus]PJJ70163.1 sulfotransferase family protein [Sediminihabitans luteus]GII97634.1 hypothetical protein Slu03_00120 [Sediminihabitans luteus]